MNDTVITSNSVTDLINNSYNEYNYYNAEELDFSLNESLSLLKNELKRLEKKIIVTQLTLKYNSNNRGYWVDEDYFEVLNTDLVYYKEKYECVRWAILNILDELKNNQCIDDDINNSVKTNIIEDDNGDENEDDTGNENEDDTGNENEDEDDIGDENEDENDIGEDEDDQDENEDKNDTKNISYFKDSEDENANPLFVKSEFNKPILRTPIERLFTYISGV